MCRRHELLFIVPLMLTWPALPLAAEQPFLLKGGETIVFFGDSITQNGRYINYFEAYLLTRFPDKSFRVINHGINGETISGATEEDHDPPRPWAMPRFDRDVAAWKPDVVVACFGMNDGNYHPFERPRYRKYQAGIRELIRRTKEQTHAQLILMTPPPFDPYHRRAHDPAAATFGYKFAAIDYDETLAKYSNWLISLRKEGQVVVDLHAKMNEHVRRRRVKKVSFSISPDAIHPNATGHWLMTQYLLLELHAPAVVAEVTVDVVKKSVTGNGVKDFKVFETADALGTSVSFRWTAPLPMPMDTAWDSKSIELERVAQRLNRYRLRVGGLKEYEFGYSLRVEGKHAGIFDSDTWNRGFNLAQLPREKAAELSPRKAQLARLNTLPPNVRAGELLSLVQQRRRLNYVAWRAGIAGKPVDPKTTPRVKELTVRIEKLRTPRPLTVQIQPFPGI